MALTKPSKNSNIVINNTNTEVTITDFKDDQLVINNVTGTIVFKSIKNGITSLVKLFTNTDSINSVGTLFKQLTNVTVANTTVETSLFSTLPLLKANSLNVGDVIRCRFSGFISDTSTPTTVLKIKVGTTTLVSSSVTFPVISGTAHFDGWFDLCIRTIGSTGTIIGQGATLFKDTTTASAGYNRGLLMTDTAVIDTTIDNALDLTYAWSTAAVANNITCTNVTIEKV